MNRRHLTVVASSTEMITPVDPLVALESRVLNAARAWATETLAGAPRIDTHTVGGQATLALLDAVHELDMRNAGQRMLALALEPAPTGPAR